MITFSEYLQELEQKVYYRTKENEDFVAANVINIRAKDQMDLEKQIDLLKKKFGDANISLKVVM